MKTDAELKDMVKKRYSQIADQNALQNASTCCGATAPTEISYTIMMDDYTHLKGYASEANLGLGCGLPTQYAKISKGHTVVDLGSGAGNDCFIARHETGPTGKVIGLDFSPVMIEKARTNAASMGFNNVEFREADIEDMPVLDNEADVVVSNCVLNLLPKKEKVFKEIYRILKSGGHFSISDVVLVGELPAILQEDAEMYAGCVSGAIQKELYLQYIEKAGFEKVQIQKEKAIVLPDELLKKYISTKKLEEFKAGDIGIFSITVFAKKPTTDEPKLLQQNEVPTCAPNTGCC